MFTPQEKEAVIGTVAAAIVDLQDYLHSGCGPVDHLREWPEVAAAKAARLDLVASALKKINGQPVAGYAESLAREFRNEGKGE